MRRSAEEVSWRAKSPARALPEHHNGHRNTRGHHTSAQNSRPARSDNDARTHITTMQGANHGRMTTGNEAQHTRCTGGSFGRGSCGSMRPRHKHHAHMRAGGAQTQAQQGNDRPSARSPPAHVCCAACFYGARHLPHPTATPHPSTFTAGTQNQRAQGGQDEDEAGQGLELGSRCSSHP